MFTDDFYKKHPLDEIISIPEFADRYFKDLSETVPPEKSSIFFPNSQELQDFIRDRYSEVYKPKADILSYLLGLSESKGRKHVNKLLCSLLETASLYYLSQDAINRKRQAHKKALRKSAKNTAKTKIDNGIYLAKNFSQSTAFNKEDSAEIKISKFTWWCAPRREGKFKNKPPAQATARKWLKEAGII